MADYYNFNDQPDSSMGCMAAFNSGGMGNLNFQGTSEENKPRTGSLINSSKHENDSRKIFIGGLDWSTTEDNLREHFEQFGQVLEIKLKTDINTGHCRGFAFLLFADESSVDQVMACKEHIILGKKADPKRAAPGGSNGTVSKVFIGGIESYMTEEEITESFSKFGKVEEIILPTDSNNQRRSFGFIQFDTERAADKASAARRIKVGRKLVDVRKVLPKEVKEQKDALFKGQVPCAGYAGFAGAQGGLIESAYGGYGIGRGAYNYHSPSTGYSGNGMYNMTPCSNPSGPAQETADKKYSHGSHGGNYSSVPQAQRGMNRSTSRHGSPGFHPYSRR